MKTIAILSQKGGAGKTTLAIHLAGAAESSGLRAVILDLDPQASAKGWHDQREQQGRDAPFVISAHASRLRDVLTTAGENGADLCIIDTAPHSDTDALAAAKAADLILIPCRTGILDIRAIANSVDIVQLAKRPALIVLNAIPHQGRLPDHAEEALASYGIPVAKVRLGQRAAFGHSLTAGQTIQEFEPLGAAAAEIRALATHAWMQTGMHARMQTTNHEENLTA
jgi:chromosome partitioning protein